MRKAHHRRSGPALPAARSVLRGVVSVDTPQGLEPFAREDALRQVVEVKSPGALTGAVRLPMLATLCGLGPGRNRAASGRLYNGWFPGRPERCLLGQNGQSLAQVPGNPLEASVT